MPTQISKSARNLLHKMFVKQPEYRITSSQIFNDPWLTMDDDDYSELGKVQ